MATLLEAIYAKYFSPSESDFSHIDIKFYFTSFDKQKDVSECVGETLVMDNCGIAGFGSENDLRSICGRVKELSVSGNVIEDWNEVAKLLRTMELFWLNLSKNPLSEICQLSDIECNLRTLVLNQTGITWSALTTVLQICCGLEELHISQNGFDTVQLPEDGGVHEGLRSLFCFENGLNSWNDVLRLGQAFPHLEVLVIAGNRLGDVGDEPIGETFRNLRALNISQNHVNSWETVDKLNHVEQLSDLKVSGVPLLQKYPKDMSRALTVARLPNVSYLNGSYVDEDERETSERAFIRHHQFDVNKPPRYAELDSKHGPIDPLVEIDLSPERIVEVTVKFEEHMCKRLINVTQTVAQFKKKMEPFVGHPAHKFRLFYIDPAALGVYGPEEMRFPQKCLYTYHVKNGDHFEIDLK